MLLATLLAASTVQPVAASDHHDAVELIKEFMKQGEANNAAMNKKKKKKKKKRSPESIAGALEPNLQLRPLSNGQFFACMSFSSLFAFSTGIWEYSTQAEVFPLNNFLCGCLLVVASLFLIEEPHAAASRGAATKLSKRKKTLSVLGGLLCGLCISNQHTSSIYVLVCIAAVARAHNMALLRREIPTLICTAISVLIGVSPYLYLVHRSVKQSIDGWGDQRTVAGFLTHFLRKEYGTFVLASEWESGEQQDGSKFVRRLCLNLLQFSKDTMHIGVPLFVYFVTLSVKNKKVACNVVALSFFIYTLTLNFLANLTFSKLHLNILARMWQQGSVASFALSGAGFARVVGLAEEHGKIKKAHRGILHTVILSLGVAPILMNMYVCRHGPLRLLLR